MFPNRTAALAAVASLRAAGYEAFAIANPFAGDYAVEVNDPVVTLRTAGRAPLTTYKVARLYRDADIARFIEQRS